MAKRFWFEKFIGCCFGIGGDEYIFNGTYENTKTKNGKPYQYEFIAEGKPQILLTYKEARQVMGTMIEKYRIKQTKQYPSLNPDYVHFGYLQ